MNNFFKLITFSKFSILDTIFSSKNNSSNYVSYSRPYIYNFNIYFTSIYDIVQFIKVRDFKPTKVLKTVIFSNSSKTNSTDSIFD